MAGGRETVPDGRSFAAASEIAVAGGRETVADGRSFAGVNIVVDGGTGSENDNRADESLSVESFSDGIGRREGARNFAGAARSVRTRDGSAREDMVICEFERERERE